MTAIQRARPWTDEQLASAVRVSTSWRGVLRQLGVKSHAASVIGSVRRRAGELDLDTSHFRGTRSWSDEQLSEAIASSKTWDETLGKLGLSSNSGNIRPFLKNHAVRLGIDYSHLSSRPPVKPEAPAGNGLPALFPQKDLLRDAAASMAASWFALAGCPASVPLEPAIYDLVAELPDGFKRVQVKTTTHSTADGWIVTVGRRRYAPLDQGPVVPYGLGTVDYFFIVDGDLTMYLIPAMALAGATRVSLRTYQGYIIGSAGGFGPIECQAS